MSTNGNQGSQAQAERLLQAIRLLGLDLRPDPAVLPQGAGAEQVPALLGVLSALVDREIARSGSGVEDRERVAVGYLSRFLDPATDRVRGEYLAVQASVASRVAEQMAGVDGTPLHEIVGHLAGALRLVHLAVAGSFEPDDPVVNEARIFGAVERELRAALRGVEDVRTAIRVGPPGADGPTAAFS